MQKYSWADVETFAHLLARRYKELQATPPDVIVGLETGGAFVAGLLKPIMGVKHMVVLDVIAEGGDYYLGGLAQLQDMGDAVVFGVDDGFRRGELFEQLGKAIRRVGATEQLGAFVRVDWFRPEEAHRRPSEELVDRIMYVETVTNASGVSWPWKENRLMG